MEGIYLKLLLINICMKVFKTFYFARWRMVSVSIKLLSTIEGVSLEEVHGGTVSKAKIDFYNL